MMKPFTTDYLSPRVDVIEFHQTGILCASIEFGSATTDNFTYDDDISSNF